MLNIDKWLFHTIHSLAGTFEPLDNFFIFFGEYSRSLMAVILLVGASILLLRTYYQHQNFTSTVKVMAIAILLVAVPVLLSDLLRDVIMRARPFVAFDITPLLEQEVRPSLPSNHTTASFAIAGFFLVYLKKVFPIVGITALLVGISRIYIGAHFPLDIVSGAILGMSPSIIYLIYQKQKNSKNSDLMRRPRA